METDVNIYTEKCNLFLITELCINPMQCCSKLALIAPFPSKTEMWRARKERVSFSAGEEVEDYHFDLLLLCHTHTHTPTLLTDETGNKEKKSGIAASNVSFPLVDHWSSTFTILINHLINLLFPLYFFPSIKIEDGWQFLRSHFTRPRKAKCKNHLKLCNVGLTVQQVSSPYY